jgi:RNA-binding protein
MMRELRGYQRSRLLELAHELRPVVMIGRSGYTEAVVKAADAALESHELIKVKFQDFKDEKLTLAEKLAADTGAILVRVLGNIAILFRTNPDPDKRKIFLPGGHFGGEGARNRP